MIADYKFQYPEINDDIEYAISDLTHASGMDTLRRDLISLLSDHRPGYRQQPQQQQEHRNQHQQQQQQQIDDQDKPRRVTAIDEMARQFLSDFGVEIRDIICGNKRQSEVPSLKNKKLGPAMTMIAVMVMQRLGFPEPIAIGFTTYVLLVVAEASRNRFCAGETHTGKSIKNSPESV